MNILMTGATSFVGSALAKELLKQGNTVYGVLRPDSPNREVVEKIKGLQLVEADMAEFRSLSKRGLPKMDACVHLSWAGPGRISRQDPVIQAANEKAAMDMLEAAGELGCRTFIFSGSQAEYGVTAERVQNGIFDGKPVSEETGCMPLSEYGKSKLKMLEKLGKRAKELGMQYLHLRIFSVYGEGDHPSTLVNLCVKTFAKGEHIKLSACAQDWNMLYIEDCARAIAGLIGVRMPDTGKSTDAVVNVGSEDTGKLKDFVEKIRETAGKGSYELEGIIPSPEGTPWVSPDIGKLERLTGFKPQVPFDEGIRRILNHCETE